MRGEDKDKPHTAHMRGTSREMIMRVLAERERGREGHTGAEFEGAADPGEVVQAQGVGAFARTRCKGRGEIRERFVAAVRGTCLGLVVCRRTSARRHSTRS